MSNFQSTFKIEKQDASRRLVFGWAVVCKGEDGKPYLDTQGDYIPEDVMLAMVTDFMKAGAPADVMHNEKKSGTVLFSMPITDATMPPGYVGKMRGWWVGTQFDQAAFDKFTKGDYRGFSIGGWLFDKVEVPEGHCLECEKPDADCTCKPMEMAS